MKFDVIVGNPPYQDTDSQSPVKLWQNFVKKSLELVEEKGLVALITPTSWMSPENELFPIIKNLKCHYINFDTKKHFSKLGTTACSFQLQKETSDGQPTKIISEGNCFDIDMRNISFIPVIAKKEIFDILDKLFSKPTMGIVTDSFCHTQRKDKISEFRDNRYKFPVRHTNKKTVYSIVKHPNCQHPKVMFSMTGAMRPEIDMDGEFGTSQHFAYIKVSSLKDAKRIVKFLESDIIKFVKIVTNWTGMWPKSIITKIPSIARIQDETLDNNSLFNFFGISPDETDIINNVCLG
jgi:hypothetical protein